jgi:hypothetical protein
MHCGADPHLLNLQDAFSDSSSVVSASFGGDDDIEVGRALVCSGGFLFDRHSRLWHGGQVGDRVAVYGKGNGLVRFKGSTKFKSGLWCVCVACALRTLAQPVWLRKPASLTPRGTGTAFSWMKRVGRATARWVW